MTGPIRGTRLPAEVKRFIVPVYHHRSRPARPRPVTDESEPNKTWRYDFLTRAGDYHCVPVLDGCSRKITGRYFGSEQTSAAVHEAWDKALARTPRTWHRGRSSP